MSQRRPTAMRGGWGAVAAALILLTCVSCSRLEPVSSPDVNAQQLVGQLIRVTTTDGRILEFRVSAVTDEALVGVSEEVRFDEIALVERRDFSFWGGACALAGGTVLVLGVGVLVVVAVFLAGI